MVLEVLTE